MPRSLRAVVVGSALLVGCVRFGFESGASPDGSAQEAPSVHRDAGADEGVGARDVALEQPPAAGDAAVDAEAGAPADAAPPDTGAVEPWMHAITGDSNRWVCGVAIAPNGDVLLALHSASSSLDLGGGAVPVVGSYDVYLARYDASGAYLWSRQLGGPQAEMCNALAADTQGNATLVGNFSGTTDFGAGPVTSLGGIDIFMTSFASDGTTRWSKRFGGSTNDSPSAIAVDSQGNIAITGYSMGAIDLGGGVLPGAGIYDAFVAKYDTDGVYSWSTRVGGPSTETGGGIAFDATDDIVLSGCFYADIDLGGGKLNNAGGADVFVAAYSSQGGLSWSRRFGGAGEDTSNWIAVASDGQLVVAGSFEGTVDFGGGPLSSAGAADVFMLGLGPSGSYRWSLRCGGADGDSAAEVAVDGAGNVLVGFHFSGSADCGAGPALVSAGYTDVMLVSVSAAGALRWAERFGGASNDYLGGVALASYGTVLAGVLGGSVDYGGGTSGGSGDAFYTTVPWLPSDTDISP